MALVRAVPISRGLIPLTFAFRIETSVRLKSSKTALVRLTRECRAPKIDVMEHGHLQPGFDERQFLDIRIVDREGFTRDLDLGAALFGCEIGNRQPLSLT